MREANPERQYEHQLKQIPSQKHLTKEAVLSEIQHLKKVILNIEQRQLSKTKKINTVEQKQQRVNQYDQLKLKTNSSSSDSRLQFGSKFFKDVNQIFRARMVNRKHRVNDQSNDHSIFNKYWQEGEQQKSIIQMADQLNKADSSNFVSERPDSQEEDCPGTQLYTPTAKPKSRHIVPNNGGPNKDFHFRKVDYIPALEEDNNKFYSYIKDYKQKAFNIKKRFGREQQKSNTFRMMNVSSQPQIAKKTVKNKASIHRSQPSFEDELFKNTLHKDSLKQQFISFGQTIFSQYLPSFNSTDKFTIKKYKNCAVFSLLPHITKAAIWYYSKELFIGNISLNESGKFQRNGPGLEIVKDRHKYNGYFVNSKKNGRGKIVYQNGDQYDGQWYEGEIYGFGRFKEGKTSKVFEGFWKNGQFCSPLNNAINQEQFKFP